MNRFHDSLDFEKREIDALLPSIHAPCLSDALLFGKTDFTFARVGISMCGHRPSRGARLLWILERQVCGLHRHPVLSFKAIVGQLQGVEADA